MNQKVAILMMAVAGCMPVFGQSRNGSSREQVLRVEKEFSEAVVRNDASAVERFLSDDWTIIDSDGGVIDKARFLGVIRSGLLTHEKMDSADVSVKIYGTTAIVSALTTTVGKYDGQPFTTKERATDVFIRQETGRWRCVFTQLTKFAKN